MSSLFYFFKESLQGFARNLSTTLGSIITIFLSLLIIGVFLVGGTIVERLVSSIEDEVSITAYVADDAPQESIDAVTAMIQGMDGVESVGFTTKEQALENFSNSMTTNPEIIEQLDGTNPLPASIDVSLADPQKVDEIAAAIEADETFRSICDEPDNPADSLKYGQKTVDRLFSVTKYVRYLGVALVLLLVFIALVFINNTIRLAIMAGARRSPSCAWWARPTGSSAGPSSWRAPCTPLSARFWPWASCRCCACTASRSCKAPCPSSRWTSRATPTS